MGGRLRENCNSQSGTVQVRQQESLWYQLCEVQSNSADSTKLKESCFAYEIDVLFHGEIFIQVETDSDLVKINQFDILSRSE